MLISIVALPSRSYTQQIASKSGSFKGTYNFFGEGAMTFDSKHSLQNFRPHAALSGQFRDATM